MDKSNAPREKPVELEEEDLEGEFTEEEVSEYEEVDEDGEETIEEEVSEDEEQDLEEEVDKDEGEDLRVELAEGDENDSQEEINTLKALEEELEDQLEEELNDDGEKLEYHRNCSNEKKRPVEETTSEVIPEQTYPRKKSKEEENSNSKSETTGFDSAYIGSGLGVSNAVCDLITSAENGRSGSSGKRKHSRWDTRDVQGDKSVNDGDDRISKRRKTRWDIGESELKLVGPMQLPDMANDFLNETNGDADFQWLKDRLIELNSLLKCSDIHDKNFVETLSIKFRNKLIRERQTVIAKLIKKNPFFKHTPDFEPQKVTKKLYIPVKEYPDFNFIGLIIGPRGTTLKKMEKESGARIFLRGKSSSLKISDDPSDNEDLHVLIEAGSQYTVDIAVKMVEKLLNPLNEGCIDHKSKQLLELAKLNGTCKDKDGCKLCQEPGHMHYACPNSKSTFSRFTDPALSTPSPIKKINDAKLYVGRLPQDVDEARLSELFYPFGKLKDVKVIKDHTTGMSKGYGFVEFENTCDATVATEHTNGFKMDGHILAVNVAERPRTPAISIVSYPPMHPGPIRLPQVVHSASFRSPAVTTPLTPGQISNFLLHSQPSINSYQPGKVPVLSPIPLPQLPDNLDYSASEFKPYVMTPPVIRSSPVLPSPNNLVYSGSQFMSSAPVIRPSTNNLNYPGSDFKSYLARPPVPEPSSSGLLSRFAGDPDYPGSTFL